MIYIYILLNLQVQKCVYIDFETFRHSIYLLSTQNYLHHLSRYVFKRIFAGSFRFISSHQVNQIKRTYDARDSGIASKP